MNTPKNSFSRMVGTLVVVTVVAAFCLGMVHEWTREPIAQAKLQKQKQAISKVAGTYDNDPVGEAYEMTREYGQRHRFRKRMHRHEGYKRDRNTEEVMLYPVKEQQEIKVVVIRASSDDGYNGRIELMVGFDPQGVIKNIEVLEHRETPGLGSKISEKKYINQYLGKNPANFDLRVTTDGGQVDALSGATISSRAFSEAVQTAHEAFMSEQDEEGSE